MIDVRWLWLFLDTPRAEAPGSWAFWSRVTGWPLSPTRGDDDEFATLVPPRGDPWLKLQAVAEGPGGIHHVRLYDRLPGRSWAVGASLSDDAVRDWGTVAARVGRARIQNGLCCHE